MSLAYNVEQWVVDCFTSSLGLRAMANDTRLEHMKTINQDSLGDVGYCAATHTSE